MRRVAAVVVEFVVVAVVFVFVAVEVVVVPQLVVVVVALVVVAVELSVVVVVDHFVELAFVALVVVAVAVVDDRLVCWAVMLLFRCYCCSCGCALLTRMLRGQWLTHV